MPPRKQYIVDSDSILIAIDSIVQAEFAEHDEAIAAWRVERRQELELSWLGEWNRRRHEPIPAGYIEGILAEVPYPLNVAPSGWVYVADIYDRDILTESQRQEWRKAIRDLRLRGAR